MKKIKIYFVTEDLSIPGGAEKILTLLANELCLIYDIEIINLNLKEKLFYPLNNKVKITNLAIENRKMRVLKILHKLNKINFEKNSIIVGVGFTNSYFLKFLFKKNLKKVSWEHMGHEILGWKGKVLKKLIYPFFTSIISLTKYDLEKYYLKMNKKSICIPNFIEKNLNKDISSKREKRIISIGRLCNQKGFDYLIKIWESLEEHYSDWTLEIYGIGDLENELKKQVTEKNLKNIKFMGLRKNVSDIMNKSSLYAMTSRYEGLPMVLLEALDASLPIISFDCPTGPSDIIDDEKNGYLIKGFNLNEYIKKISILMEDEQKRIEMSKESQKKSLNFEKNKIIKLWINFFDTI